MTIQGYKYRIYPDKGQKVLLEKHIGSCRFVYNKLLHIKQILYEKFKMSILEFDLNNHFTVLKNIYPWLKEVNSQSLQQASNNLNSAFNHFLNIKKFAFMGHEEGLVDSLTEVRGMKQEAAPSRT